MCVLCRCVNLYDYTVCMFLFLCVCQVLSHCERITDAGIRSLVSGHCADELQVLELDNCPLITDQSLEMLR